MGSGRDGHEADSVTRLLADRAPRETVQERQALADIEARLFGRHEPVKLARYVLLERIAAGGAGIVYAAYDPELDRKVAIKLLRPDGHEADDEGRERLAREARALARLSHPNVIEVFDVGTYDEPEPGVFVVMELVDGTTLRDWLADETRTWRAVLEVFRAAGRGLVAAHTAGLVHRDFKPTNVLVGHDGRVRVLDFGLASGPDQTREDSGGVMGTIPYMAPEQHRGAATDERTDQYNFSVALFEGLYRARPFAGATLEELEAAKRAEALAAPATEGKVPRWVHRAVVRGLAADPEARFGAMTDLLDALDRDPARRIRRALLGVGGAALVIGLAWGVGAWRDAKAQACRHAAAELEGVWDPAIESRARDAFLRTGKPYAADSWRSVVGAVGTYAWDWVDRRTAACEATMVAGDQSQAAMRNRLACFDRKLRVLGELTEILAQADPKIVEHAVVLVGALPTLDECDDIARLSSDPAPADRVDQLAELDAQLARGKALRNAAKYAESGPITEAALATARRLGHPPAEARALLGLGRQRLLEGDLQASEQTLYDALVAAERARRPSLAVEALSGLVRVGVDRGLDTQGQRLAAFAYARISHGGVDPKTAALLAYNTGIMHGAAGRHTQALAAHQRALELQLAASGPDHPDVAAVLNGIATALYGEGRIEDALTYFQRSLAIWRSAVGERHPMVADLLNNLGVMAVDRGRYAEGIAQLELARSIYVELVGPEHPNVARPLNAIAVAHGLQGDDAGAIALHREALALEQSALGDDHPQVGVTLRLLGQALSRFGDHETAIAQLERSLAIQEPAWDERHPEVASALEQLAWAYLRSGAPDRAQRYFDRAWALWERARGPDHPSLLRSRTELAAWRDRG